MLLRLLPLLVLLLMLLLLLLLLPLLLLLSMLLSLLLLLLLLSSPVDALAPCFWGPSLPTLKLKLRRPGGALMPRPSAFTYASLSVHSCRKQAALLLSSGQAAAAGEQ